MSVSLQVLPPETSVGGATSIDLAAVDGFIARFGDQPEHIVPLLQAVQDHYHYLPAEALRHIADHTRITPAALTGVATFFQQFRHHRAGAHLVRICHGTACHVQGSERIEDALRRQLGLAPGDDTDAAGRFTLERVGCVGCCTLAPVVVTDGQTHGRVRSDAVAAVLRIEPHARELSEDPKDGVRHHPGAALEEAEEIRIGVGSCCAAGGSLRVQRILREEASRLGVPVRVKGVGCVGMCHQTPLVEVLTRAGGTPRTLLYTRLQDASDESIRAIVGRHFRPRGIAGLWHRAGHALALLAGSNGHEKAVVPLHAQSPPIDAFLRPQWRIATELCGHLDPLDLDEYLRHEGFAALRSAPEPRAIIDIILRSGLRGRGGAGFPTGRKWQAASAAPGDEKYILCNGDEGDPGAFMDRMILESYPYRVLEGMAIAARAIGARRGLLYIRHEYPLAVERIRAALARCRERGTLGDLQLDVREGAGAFVCGEETALIASLEGRRGMPRLRPPFPAESGLWGKPTCINNVETLAMVPWILRHGADAFAAIGTAQSKGTKVFSLTGKVQRTGLIEVPMGTTLRQIVEDIGGGIAQETPPAEMLPGRHPPRRTFKAVQIGGPSGGCIPAHLADTPVDFESLRDLGAIMGSGGLVVLDNRDCMVDMARYFLQFTQAESCGKCGPCRIGTKRMLEILDRLTAGRAKPQDLVTLEELALEVRQSSLCGLGQTAPNPVLTTLRFFRDEFEAHLRGHCPAGRCTGLVKYVVTKDCVGCTRCVQVCPVQAIPFTPYQVHTIDAAKCTRCDACRPVCPAVAIEVRS